jgi:hypothetical protein
MAKVKVNVILKDGDQYQIVIKVGGQTLHFRESGSQTIELDSKNYRTLIAGFQDPTNTDSTVEVEFKQGNQRLNDIVITERKFIKSLDITVN